MIVADVLVAVRDLLQDANTNPALQRYTDDQLVGIVNQTLKRTALLRPDLFAYIGDVPLTAGETLQTAPTDSIRIMQVLRVKDGKAVREVDRVTMDATYPNWVNDPQAACTEWMRHPRNANRFFVYPAAPTGQILVMEYAKSPAQYVIGDTIALLPDVYFPVIVDGSVYLAEAIDSESVSTQRSTMFQQSYTAMLASQMESRNITDGEDAGISQKKGG